MKQPLSLRAFLGVERGEGSWKNKKNKPWEREAPCQGCNVLQDVCWFHLSSVNPAEEWSIPLTVASEPQLYIYNYNYSNLSIYLPIYFYLYKYTLKSVTALAPNTEEKYWRCCWMQVVALTEIL